MRWRRRRRQGARAPLRAERWSWSLRSSSSVPSHFAFAVQGRSQGPAVCELIARLHKRKGSSGEALGGRAGGRGEAHLLAVALVFARQGEVEGGDVAVFGGDRGKRGDQLRSKFPSRLLDFEGDHVGEGERGSTRYLSENGGLSFQLAVEGQEVGVGGE